MQCRPSNRIGPAQDAGLKLGDVIVGFDYKTVSNIDDLYRLLEEKSIGNSIELNILRKGVLKVLDIIPRQLN
ncbi:MAG: PDZ domain-containing protein [Bacteroidetes bacterium]|nr:PDZ domain-containing protein [Bacteroidota bacterium]